MTNFKRFLTLSFSVTSALPRLKTLILTAFLMLCVSGVWADVTDAITASDLAATSTSYVDFSGVSKTSDAVYAGNSAKNSSNIQLRSDNSNSGIVSTTSGGIVKSVKITVGSGSKTIDVYGSNSAYSAATDLYGSSKGTLIGSLTATGTITFSDDYEYVGIRSHSGALYLSKVEITWTSGTSYTITPETNNSSYGTVSLSGKKITATPKTNYRVSTSNPYSVSPSGSATVSQSGNEFTVTPSANTTITINFEAIPTHTVTFYNGGSTVYGTPQSIAEGADIAKPADPTHACTEYTFVGWTTTPQASESTTSPTIISSWPQTMSTSDVEYYAVYKRTEGGGGSPTLTKMVKGDTFSDGDKIVIVSNTSNTVALYQETVSSSYVETWTFDGNVSTVASDDKNWLTVTATTGGWYLGDATNGYLNNSNNNLYCDNDQSVWTLTDNNDGTFLLLSGSRYLCYRTDLTTVKWRMNSTSSLGILDIYKYASSSGGTDYYTTSPTCSGYTITVNAADHGSAVSDKSRQDENGSVTITLTPDVGYACNGITTSPSRTVTTDGCAYTFTMPAQDVTVTPSFVLVDYTITVTQPSEGGSITAKGQSASATANYNDNIALVATPASGWQFSAWTVTKAGGGTVTVTSNAFSMPADNVTVQALFVQEVTLSFSVPIGCDGVTAPVSQTTVQYGTVASLPSSPGNPADKGYTFVGWVENSIASDDTNKPTIYEAGESYTMEDEDVTLYALYSKSVSGGGAENYVKVTDTPDSWAGTYLIVYEDGAVALKGSEVADATNNTISVTISDATIEANTTTNANAFTIALVSGETDKYTIRGADNNYIGRTANSNGLDKSSSTAYVNSLTYGGGDVNIVSSEEAYLRYNSASNQARFRYYGSSSYTGQKAIQLYKKQSTSTVYYITEIKCLDDDEWELKYNANGGTGTMASEIYKLNVNATVQTNAFTAPTGHNFKEWNTQADGNGSTIAAGNNVTRSTRGTYNLYAIWQPSTYTLYYRADGSALSNTTVTYGSTVTLTTATGCGDWAFAGWSTNATSTDAPEYDGTMLYQTAGDVTLYAVYYNSGTSSYSTTAGCCPDVPYDVSALADVKSAIIQWSCKASTATVTLYSDAAGTTVVKELTSQTSPCNVTDLAEGTTYYYRVSAGGTCASALGSFTTIESSVSIARWYPDGVDIELNVDGTPYVLIEGQTVEGNTSGGTIANDLFFSKYYEATGDLKLLGLYNGTDHDIDVTNITIGIGAAPKPGKPGDANSRSIKRTTGVNIGQYIILDGLIDNNTINSGQEIILYTWKDTGSDQVESGGRLDKCVNDKVTEELGGNMAAQTNWYNIEQGNTHGYCNWSGRQAIALWRGTTMIDIIGAYKEVENDGLEANGDSIISSAGLDYDADDYGWIAKGKLFDLVEQCEGDSGYIGTCRSLLIRKSSVKDGLASVRLNRRTDTQGGFFTLGGDSCEWMGFNVGDDSSRPKTNTLVCNAFSAVCNFNYSSYYTTMVPVTDTTQLGDGQRKPDGTYPIAIAHLDTLACTPLKIKVFDSNKKEITSPEFQVPIMVQGNATTADSIFYSRSNKPYSTSHNWEIEKSRNECKKCDVVVLNGATLTKIEHSSNTGHDIEEVKNLTVYPGGKLIVKEDAFTAKSLILRRDQDTVPQADIDNSQLIVSNNIYADIRIDANMWYWISFPFNVSVAEIRFANGEKASIQNDYFLFQYNGERRAETGKSGSANWDRVTGGTLTRGVAYVMGIPDGVDAAYKKIFRFPMSGDSYNETANFDLEVNSWGADKTEMTPNHKGWNLVGNPYMMRYEEGHLNDDGGTNNGWMQLGYLVPNEVNGLRTWKLAEDKTDLPFITVPNSTSANGTGYKQVLVSDTTLATLTGYAIQVAGTSHGSANAKGLHFLAANKTWTNKNAKPAIRRGISELEAWDIDVPVTISVILRNSAGKEDETSLLISDIYSNEYELGGDLLKWKSNYYKSYNEPVLYSIIEGSELAFQAVPDATAQAGVPLGYFARTSDEYTFSLRRNKRNYAAVEEIWLHDTQADGGTDKWINLLQEDYTFQTNRQVDNTDRFYIAAKVNRKKSPTDLENVIGQVSVTTDGLQLTLHQLPEKSQVWIYNAAGQLVTNEVTNNFSRTYAVPQAGVYMIRVLSPEGGQMLRTIVY